MLFHNFKKKKKSFKGCSKDNSMTHIQIYISLTYIPFCVTHHNKSLGNNSRLLYIIFPFAACVDFTMAHRECDVYKFDTLTLNADDETLIVFSTLPYTTVCVCDKIYYYYIPI